MPTLARSYPGPDAFEQAMLLSLNDFIERQLGVTGTVGRSRPEYVRYSSCPNAGCRAAVNRNSVRLVVKDDRSFRCWRCGCHGNIVHAAMEIFGFDRPIDAALFLNGDSAAPPRRVSVVTPELLAKQKAQKECLTKVLGALLAVTEQASNDVTNIEYLTKVRGLPIDIIREAQNRRLLGFLPSSRKKASLMLKAEIGEDLLKQSGLWIETSEDPWIAGRPLLFFFPGLTSVEFRLNREPRANEKKSLLKGARDFPWFWRGKDPTRALAVEGFIDMISAAALNYPGHIIGLPGCNSWDPEWFTKLKAMGVIHFDIGFDDDWEMEDNPGQVWASILADHLKDLGASHRIAKPDRGDMNELLRSFNHRKEGTTDRGIGGRC